MLRGSASKAGIWQRMRAFIRGADGGGAHGEIDMLRRELARHQEEIGRLRKEYALLREQAREHYGRAAGESLEAVVREFAIPLATISAMQVRFQSTGQVVVSDLFRVVSSFQTILAEQGLEQVGAVGEDAPYDPSLHQMLEGPPPRSGDPVRIRFSGYRFRGKLVAKAQCGRTGHSK